MEKFSRDLIQLLNGHILSLEQSSVENIVQSTAKCTSVVVRSQTAGGHSMSAKNMS